MGRARKLEWMLIRNFPQTPDGEPDWSIFEGGPPEYLCEFLQVLDQRAKETWPRLLRCQRQLGMPDWEAIKSCPLDPNAPKRYLYNPGDWGFRQRIVSQSEPLSANTKHPSPKHADAPQKRPRMQGVSAPTPSNTPTANAAPSTTRCGRSSISIRTITQSMEATQKFMRMLRENGVSAHRLLGSNVIAYPQERCRISRSRCCRWSHVIIHACLWSSPSRANP